MNLLVLDQFSDLGGGQRCLLEMLAAARDAGWHALVGLPGAGELISRIHDLGFRTAPITCGPYTSGAKSASDAVRFLSGTPRLAREIRRLVQEARADLVYINGPRLLPAAALARPAVPVLVHSHRILPPGAMRRLAGASLRRLNPRVIAVCQDIAESWRPFVSPGRLSVIYNGVAGPAQPTWRPHGESPRIGCIGRIAPEKGQREFLAAARLILRDFPSARFLVHGAALFGDPAAEAYAAEVRAEASGLPVEFAGWTPDVYRALADLDLLLVPSDEQEATTRVILEAFAAGVPAVAFPNGGVPEVITHGRDGYLARTVEEMAQFAISFLRDPAASEISANARQTWSRRFTLDRYQAEILAAIRALSPTPNPQR